MVHKPRIRYRRNARTTRVNTFRLFPQLPNELRLMIWGLASPLPRIIELSWPYDEPSKARSPISKTPPPPVLQACRESRSELIRNYDKLEFPDSPQVILVNYLQDTIFFGPGCKHLLPSGRTASWTWINRKLIRDIIDSTSLIQNLKFAAFDCSFLLALDVEGAASIEGMFHAWKKLEEVIISRPEDWKDAQDKRRRLKGIGVIFQLSAANTMSLGYEEAKLAQDFATRVGKRQNTVKKVHIADLEVVTGPIEETLCSPRISESICRRFRFLKSRTLLKVRPRTSFKKPQ